MLGRNDKCHCGSGKKYKKCHWSADTTPRPKLKPSGGVPAEVLAQLAAVQQQQKNHLATFGHAREVVHCDFQGYKVVAVGGTIYWSQNWRNFTDFLLHYIKVRLNEAFGTDWYPTEREKTPEMRHPIVRWYEAFCNLGKGRQRNEAGMFEAPADGPTLAYLRLAYDLFVIADNAHLQNEVLRRLRDRQGFQHARYELTVAATMIRAGFTIDYEDETDNTRKHPEFIATQKSSGARIAVEAKARARRGVLGWVGPRPNAEEIPLSIDHLLSAACEKQTNLPLVVFIDANMPPEMANRDVERWVSELNATLPRVAHGFGDVGVFEGVPFSLLVLTNNPEDYAAPGEPSEMSLAFISEPRPARRPLPNPSISSEIERAVRQYGAVPQEFPTDPRNTAA